VEASVLAAHARRLPRREFATSESLTLCSALFGLRPTHATNDVG
jgi:hypothetical protein